jgi:hypothetical protein
MTLGLKKNEETAGTIEKTFVVVWVIVRLLRINLCLRLLLYAVVVVYGGWCCLEMIVVGRFGWLCCVGDDDDVCDDAKLKNYNRGIFVRAACWSDNPIIGDVCSDEWGMQVRDASEMAKIVLRTPSTTTYKGIVLTIVWCTKRATNPRKIEDSYLRFGISTGEPGRRSTTKTRI